MKYVIKKGRFYVAMSGRKNSYTTMLKYARVFNSKEEAIKDKCGNETVVELWKQ